MSLEWFGAEQEAKVDKAAIIGLTKTAADGAALAKRLVHKETTELAGSIRYNAAKVISGTAEASFGVVEGQKGERKPEEYAEFQEYMPGEPMASGGTRTKPGGKPYMRPAEAQAKQDAIPNIVRAYQGIT